MGMGFLLGGEGTKISLQWWLHDLVNEQRKIRSQFQWVKSMLYLKVLKWTHTHALGYSKFCFKMFTMPFRRLIPNVI